jgi:hypothetical protein
MPRIVEHRSGLPNGPIVAVHVCRDANVGPPLFATVAVEVFGRNPSPDAFPEQLPVAEAFLDEALAYAERADIPVVWIGDPLRLFPPDKRPVREAAKEGAALAAKRVRKPNQTPTAQSGIGGALD